MKKTLFAVVLNLGLSLGLVGLSPAQAEPVGDAKAQVMRFYDEVINQNKLELVEKYFAANLIEHEPMMHPELPVSENFKAAFQELRKGFPDLKFTVEDMLLEGDLVVVRFRMQGTHKGEFMGIGPTGKSIDVPGVDILRLAGGRFVEHWGVMDSLIMMQQLGMMH